MEHRTGPRYPSERTCVPQTIRALAHYMKQAGVNDGLESCVPGHQFSRVRNCECGCDAPLPRFVAGFLDGRGSGIESNDAISLRNQVHCVLSRPTASIQNLAANLSSLHEILNEWGWAICVPECPPKPGVTFVECDRSVINL